MTEARDKLLDHAFRTAYTELAEEEFKSRVMDHVRRYERRSAFYLGAICLAVLIVVCLMAPLIQTGSVPISVFPGEAISSLAANR